jgi:L-threonylcarbamoyladenylate synthase
MSEAFAEIRKAAELLRQGRLVAFPTETVYGLGADALNENAVRAVYEVKGRPPVNPLIVHVSGPEMARRVIMPGAWDERADALARAFWPGPLSIILPKAKTLPGLVTAGGPNVAVRCPDHPVSLALLFEFGGPLVGPSANPSGSVSPTRAEHVREAFAPDVVYVLEGGACRGGIESTVVSLVGERVRVLRPGLISAAEISRVLGQPVESGTASLSGSRGIGASALESPGMLERHYAPSTRSFLVRAAELHDALCAQGNSRAAVLTIGAREIDAPHIVIEMPVWAEEYAAALYSRLRDADVSGVDRIIIEKPEPSEVSGDTALWEAILDRLRRATAE